MREFESHASLNFLTKMKVLATKFHTSESNRHYMHCDEQHDWVAEWLRRWTANPMGSARVGSNPILVGIILQYIYQTFA